MMHATIGFFGLPRSLDYVDYSIIRHVFDPLKTAGITTTRIAHFNIPKKVHSPRSGEVNLPMPAVDLSRLKLDMVWLQHQQDELPGGDATAIMMSTPWRREDDPDLVMRRNMRWQLHSLCCLYDMILMAQSPSDLFILLRPDLEYIDPLPVKEMLAAKADGVDIMTPDFARHDGLNDRFAVCLTYRGLETYCRRLEALPEMVRAYNYVHSETLVAFAVKHAQLNHRDLPMRGRRVRANGQRGAD